MTPEILFEDTHILVYVKPAGLPAQSGQIGTKDVVSILTNHVHVTQKEGPQTQPPYLALIHRLDQGVKGIMVLAKTPFAAKELNKQLTKQGFSKEYEALLVNPPPKPDGTLEDYVLKDRKSNTSKVVSSQTPHAKKALLSYETLEEDRRVRIQLVTGRHHQIRVQFAHAGCPLKGDRKYGIHAPEYQGPLCLCATRLSFLHPKTKKQMCFSCTPDF